MPNGGPDCCGNCGLNRAVQEMAHPHPSMRERFLQLSRCSLREVPVRNPFWTYCQNFHYGELDVALRDDKQIKGPIFARGLYEAYFRIPWHGLSEPEISVPSGCVVCGRSSTKGITVEHNNATVGFCTNRHYVEWWLTHHDDPGIAAEDFATPEDSASSHEP